MTRKELVKKRIAAVMNGIDGGGRIFGERNRAGARNESEIYSLDARCAKAGTPAMKEQGS